MPGPVYVVDTNSLRVFSNYYPESFPSFWEQLADLVTQRRLVSVREVRRELEFQNASQHLADWVEANKALFAPPSEPEMVAVAEIFAVPHLQQLIGQKQRLRGLPVADPFLVAAARACGGYVVTEEEFKPNGAKIPNVCDRFGVKCTNVKGMLGMEGWKY